MVIDNARTNSWSALCMVMALVAAVPGAATAETQSSKGCEIHAVAMVAEMKASAAKPMSDQEVSLVRETAIKSCLAQAGGNATSVVSTQPAAATLPQATTAVPQAQTDTSFFGTLGAIFSGPTTRKPGNQRLLDRSQH